MKTITVTETTTKEVKFPFSVPCVFKYSECQEHPKDFDTDEFYSCHLIKVDKNYNVSSIKIRKIGLISIDDIEYDFSAKSVYNLNDIFKYNMINVDNDWWSSAIDVVFNYWKDK